MVIKTASLDPHTLHVVKNKGTEVPYSGVYDDFFTPGTYLCRQCGLALFRATQKFHSGCGWPSFDEEVPAAVLKTLDADGYRTEITCARCHAHLGHVFSGEGFTAKNIRHCVNSLSLDFVADPGVKDTEEGIFAGGCFWGVESLFQKLKGVVKTEVGYMGGKKAHPTYEEVCSHMTGHLEVVRVVYDPAQLTYETLCKYFLEIHDPTQMGGQGPDIGEQYQSAIFYYNDQQANTAKAVLTMLKALDYAVVTKLYPMAVFWPAEPYHQHYYQQNGKQPYCHFYVKRFKG